MSLWDLALILKLTVIKSCDKPTVIPQKASLTPKINDQYCYRVRCLPEEIYQTFTGSEFVPPSNVKRARCHCASQPSYVKAKCSYGATSQRLYNNTIKEAPSHDETRVTSYLEKNNLNKFYKSKRRPQNKWVWTIDWLFILD